MNAAEASAPNRAKCLEAENLDGETSSGHASCASQERPRSASVRAMESVERAIHRERNEKAKIARENEINQVSSGKIPAQLKLASEIEEEKANQKAAQAPRVLKRSVQGMQVR